MKRSITLIIAVLLMAMSFHAKADLYIIGDVEGAGWSANLGVPMTETSTNVYEITININGTFAFASQLGSDANDWDGLNANRYGAESDGTAVQNGVPMPIVQTGNTAFNIVNIGEYDVVLDMNAMTMTCTSTLEIELPETLYLCGAVDEYNWQPNAGVEMTSTGDGVYTATATVNGSLILDGVNSLGYVCFVSQLGSDENDWDTFNANRYGPQRYNQVIVPGNENLITRNENSFGLSGGEYEVTVDLNANTATFTPTGYIAYNFPDVIYFIGDLEGAAWATNAGLEVAESEDYPGEYTTELTIPEGSSGYFGFAAQLVAEADDWDSFNTFRYIPAGNAQLEVGVAAPVAMNGDASFSVAPGTYTCTVQLSCIGGGTITLSENTVSVDNVDEDVKAYPVVNDGEITIVGDAGEVNVYTTSGMLIASDIETVSCPAGVYIVVIDGEAHKVLVK